MHVVRFLAEGGKDMRMAEETEVHVRLLSQLDCNQHSVPGSCIDQEGRNIRRFTTTFIHNHACRSIILW